MEAYKTSCGDCGQDNFWTGSKSGMNLDAEGWARQQEKSETCQSCGSKNVQTGLDHETDLGRTLDRQVETVVALLVRPRVRRKVGKP